MSSRTVIAVIIALIVGAAGGFIVGDNQNKPAAKKPVSSIVVRETIEPYNGVGSTVLKSGTLIEGDYKDPSSIVGTINRPGTWVIHKLVTEK